MRHMDWQRLAERMQARRLELGLTQQQAAAAGGVSLAVWGLLERGQQDRPKLTSLRAVEKALGWERGSARQVAEGGEPVELGAPSPEPADRPATSRPGRSDPMTTALAVLIGEVREAVTELHAAVEDVRQLQLELREHLGHPDEPHRPPS